MISNRTATISLLIATILAYVNSFRTIFQFDDQATILEDQRLQSVDSFLSHVGEMIRPLLKLTFLLDRAVYGTDPAGYHLLNLLLHCGTGLLVFAILSSAVRLLGTDSRPAGNVPLLAALFFLLHPIQTETVTYVSGRPTGMATFFCLLSLYLFIKADQPGLGRRGFVILYGGALGTFCLGLLSKEIAVILPAILLLWHLVFGTRAFRLHIPFWALLGLALLGAVWHPRYSFLARASLDARPVYDNLVTQANAITQALLLFFLPWRSNFDHDLPIFHSAAEWPIPACLALLGGVLVAAFWSVRRAPLFSFGVLWFFLCLLPTNSLIPRFDILSERNLYLPSIGLMLAVIALGNALVNFLEPPVMRRLAGWVCVAVAALLLLGTASRNRVYSDEVTFWSDAARKSPMKPRTHNNLGYALFRAGELDRAMEEFRTALSLDPDSASARQNLLRVWKIKHGGIAGGEGLAPGRKY